MATLAWLTDEPWVFPSLAPTVLLVYETPLRAQSSPRHAVLGHATGILLGYLSLLAFGLLQTPAATITGFTPSRIGAIAVAVGVTTLALHVIRCQHPPAGASALIVALGILRTPTQLVIMFAAVILITVLAFAFNRLIGVKVPLWSPTGAASGAEGT